MFFKFKDFIQQITCNIKGEFGDEGHLDVTINIYNSSCLELKEMFIKK